VVVNGGGRLGTAPAVAAPLKSQNKTLGRLRAENRRQSDRLHQQSVELRRQQRTFTSQIQRLRAQMQNGG
jgi:FtsZ-binding cell division protein ZapB